MRSRTRTAGSDGKGQIRRSAERATPGLVADSIVFILYSKKWWLVPIVVSLLVLSLFAGLSGTGAAPFIYALF
jgi:hypothetical protein